MCPAGNPGAPRVVPGTPALSWLLPGLAQQQHLGVLGPLMHVCAARSPPQPRQEQCPRGCARAVGSWPPHPPGQRGDQAGPAPLGLPGDHGHPTARPGHRGQLCQARAVCCSPVPRPARHPHRAPPQSTSCFSKVGMHSEGAFLPQGRLRLLCFCICFSFVFTFHNTAAQSLIRTISVRIFPFSCGEVAHMKLT